TSALFVITMHLFSADIAAWLNNGSYHADFNRYVRYFAWILAADALAVIPFARLRAEGRPVRFGILKLVNVVTFIGFNLFVIVTPPSIIEQGGAYPCCFASWYRE